MKKVYAWKSLLYFHSCWYSCLCCLLKKSINVYSFYRNVIDQLMITFFFNIFLYYRNFFFLILSQSCWRCAYKMMHYFRRNCRCLLPTAMSLLCERFWRSQHSLNPQKRVSQTVTLRSCVFEWLLTLSQAEKMEIIGEEAGVRRRQKRWNKA